jgi:nitroimidazol reductase NimA-like FMN-containing flavoprotein (pyridoxamine 5'-phosphate oxidase superfamily)
MQIEELSVDDCLVFLAKKSFGRLGCAKESQPYVTPLHFVYQDRYIYSFGTVGQKIEWLRLNPRACVEVEDIASPQHWTTVIVMGRYEELPATGETKAVRQFAHDLLQQRELWWEPGYARTIIGGEDRPLEPVYFRISVNGISGHRASSA